MANGRELKQAELRHWERAGKLRTTRDGANRRRVPRREIERLARRPVRQGAGDALSARNRFPGGNRIRPGLAAPQPLRAGARVTASWKAAATRLVAL